jgi:hypothetical protein
LGLGQFALSLFEPNQYSVASSDRDVLLILYLLFLAFRIEFTALYADIKNKEIFESEAKRHFQKFLFVNCDGIHFTKQLLFLACRDR